MQDLRVLFVGNSHTFFNDLPQVFKNLVESKKDINVEVAMQAHPGVTYNWHLSQEAELRFALIHGSYDYVFLQQAAHVPSPAPEDTIRDGKRLIQLVKENGAIPVVVVPWAERRFPEHQEIMYRTYGKLVEETQALFSPVGYVFEQVAREHPEIDLYWYDGEHCSPYGSYVNACCAYSLIFEESPLELTNQAIDSYQGRREDIEEIKGLFSQYYMDENNKELAGKIMEKWRKSFSAVWNKASLHVDLDKDKVKILHQVIWDIFQNLFA